MLMLLVFALLNILIIALIYYVKEISSANKNRPKPKSRYTVSYEETQKEKDRRYKMEAISKIEGIPTPISAESIISKSDQIRERLANNLRVHGYCLIKTNDRLKDASTKIVPEANKYFDLTLEEKNKNIDKDRNNIGYVHIPNVREYIKLRPTDPEELWPAKPETFKSAFNTFHNNYSELAFATFEILAGWIDREGNHAHPLINPDDYDAIKEHIGKKSSVSIIKYFPLEKATEVCDEHTDTGILTFITRTNRSALEMWDRKLDRYIKLEDNVEDGDIIVFVGEKVPLFSQSSKFKATPHRVRLSEGDARISIAYLLDIAK